MIIDVQQSNKERYERWSSIEEITSIKILRTARKDLNANKEILKRHSTVLSQSK